MSNERETSRFLVEFILRPVEALEMTNSVWDVIHPFYKIFSANNSTRILIYFIVFRQTEIFLDSSYIKCDNYSHKSESKPFWDGVS